MSHVHCPACRYAYNSLTSQACPRCVPQPVKPVPVPVPVGKLDALAEVDAALDRLAVALGRLDDDELDAVAVRLASTEHESTWAGVVAGAIAAAVIARRQAPVVVMELDAPEITEAAPTDRERALLAMVVALLTRLAAVTRDAATRLRRR